MYEFPKDLLYNKDYSWVKVDKEKNLATIGINDYAAKRVKEFVFIKLPEINKTIKKDETYVSLEAVKWSGHLSSPVSGMIVEVNKNLFYNPININKEPYNNWIVKIKIENKEELKELLSAEDIKKIYDA